MHLTIKLFILWWRIFSFVCTQLLSLQLPMHMIEANTPLFGP